jgi:UDP-glucose 4-epimerase
MGIPDDLDDGAELDAAVTRGQRLASLRVLVSGASGFIGSHLCRSLLTSGAEVHGVSRHSDTNNAVHWWNVDLADSEAAHHVMNEVRPGLVFHLASHVSGSRDLAAVTPTLRGNLLTTVNILTAACDTDGPRVLLAGSMEESEAGDAERTPSSPYAAAKAAGAAYGRMFHALYGLPVVNLRIAMAYGPGQRDWSKLVPYVTNALLRDEPPRLTSGSREVDWIYVEDVVDAFLAAAVADGIDGTSITVGSGELVTIRSVVEQLVELTGSQVRPQFGVVPDRPMERVRRVDAERAYESIGWRACVPLRGGLTRTVDWFRERIEDGARTD